MPDPIVQFYIKNYQMDGQFIEDETLFQTVPIRGTPVITNPKVKGEIGKSGSFEFGMELNSPYYNALRQMKTLMRVTLFGHDIFRGRVLTIDKTLSRTRTVHCEGCFSYLLDSHQIGTKEESRKTITVLEYLQKIIEQHNSDMEGEPEKQFVLGEVPGQYVNAAESQRVNIPKEKAKQQFGDTSYNTSMDRLEDLLSDFGGYFRTRYDPATGNTYLDWLDKYYNATTNAQTIEITKNLIDLSGSTEVANLFTVVVPIGKGTGSESIFIDNQWPIVKKGHAKVKYIMVPELATVPLYSDEELNSEYHRKSDYEDAISRFGKIWKTVDFANADTPEKLFSYAKDWIKNNYMPEITQWNVSAIDLKFVDGQNQVLLCGDRVDVIHPEVDQTYPGMTVISVDYDLYNPEQTKYVIGIPNQEINSAYGVKNKVDKNTGTKKGKSKGSSGGSTKPPNGAKGEVVESQLDELRERLLTEYSYKTDWKGNIGRDDPNAYLMYNTDGSEKNTNDVIAAIQSTYANLRATRLTKQQEILDEAIRRGVSTNDPQLLIDLTPKEKAKQNQFKSDSEYYYVNTVGMSMEEAALLLNDSVSQSWLASLVDDDGNWTQEAYDKGCMMWQDRDNIKIQALQARQAFAGTRKQNGHDVISTAKDAVYSVVSKVGNFLNVDGMDFSFDLGNLWTDPTTGKSLGDILGISGNTEGGTLGNCFNFLKGMFTGEDKGGTTGSVFDLVTNVLDLNGENGFFGLGKKLSEWRLILNGSNQPVTYTGSDGKTYTVPSGVLKGEDFHLKEIPSFKTKMAWVDEFYADQIEANKLFVTEARVKTLIADKVDATYVRSLFGDTWDLSVYQLTVSNGWIKVGGVDYYPVTINTAGGSVMVLGHR